MGILGKLFGKKDKTKVEGTAIKGVGVTAKLHEGEKVIAQNNLSPKIEVATLSYGYHTIPVEAFREGLKKHATIKAFCDKTGDFIPLGQLGDRLLLSDPKTNTTLPLLRYKGEEYKDIYDYVFGSGYNHYEYGDDE